MKRKEKKPFSNKVIRGFIWSFGVAFIGLGVGLYSQNQLIQAKPDDGTNTPIVVDRGTAEEYQLPYDSNSLFEPELIGNSSFSNYIQKDLVTSSFNLSNFYGYGEYQYTGSGTVPTDQGSLANDVALFDDGTALFSIRRYNDSFGSKGTMHFVNYGENGKISEYIQSNALPATSRTTGELIDLKGDKSEYASLINEEGRASFAIIKKNVANTLDVQYVQTDTRSSKFKSHEILAFNSDFDSIFATSLFVNDPNRAGLTHGKIPLGKFNTNQISVDSTKIFEDNPASLDNITLEDIASQNNDVINYATDAYISPNQISSNRDYYYGSFSAKYVNTQGVVKNYNLLMIFNKNKSNGLYPLVWSKVIPNVEGVTMDVKFVSDFTNSDTEFAYLSVDGNSRTTLNFLDLTTGKDEIVGEYPLGTTMTISKTSNSNIYSYYGSIPEFTYDFNGFVNGGNASNYIISGIMTFDNGKKVEVKSLTSKGTDGVTTFKKLIPFKNNDFLAIGLTNARNVFQDGIFEGNTGSTRAVPYITSLTEYFDYAPAIKKSETIQVDIDSLSNSNRDQQLLTGKDNNKAFDVYDVQDSNNSAIEGKPGQDWLNARINRNPNAPTNPIDWEALGFEDNGKIGPNRVTYFVTDSQKQTTSTSRIVNKIDSHTVLNKKGAIGAYNFGIKLADVGNLTDASLRDPSAYAQLMAWDLDDETVDVLSLPAAQGVEINSTQLDAIRQATEFGVFDLTFTLNYGDEPKEVTIKVFVSEDGPVEGFSYDVQENEIPWDISRNITGEAYPNSEYAKIQAYKISTGEKIDKNNTSYQIKADVGALNAADPNPADYTATQAVKVPLAIYKTNGSQPEATFKTIPDTTVYYRVEDVKIAFTDWNFGTLYDVDGNTLQAAGVELKNQIVGKTTAIKTNQDVVDAIDAISLKGYEKEKFYLSDKQTELTVDGLEIVFNEGKGYQYYLRFKGLLELVSVPSKIDFGQGESTLGTMRKNDPTVTGSLVISDTRADTTKNWTLKAELSKPMTSLSGNTVIPDAIRYKRSGQAEFILDANKQVMLANNAGTFGTFNVSDTWGTGKDDDGFKFEAQAVKVHEIGKYQATIKYTLSDTYEP